MMNFYRPKYVTCKKTESGRHTRCSRGSGRAHHPHGALVSFPDCYLFFYFSKYSKMEKYCLKIVLESVYLPYHIPIPFRSLERSRSMFLVRKGSRDICSQQLIELACT